MKPTVGRIVHYVSYGTPGGEYTSQCRAAVVTEVPFAPLPTDPADLRDEGAELLDRGRVGLAVLNPTGMFFHEADYSEVHDGGSWHWPERD